MTKGNTQGTQKEECDFHLSTLTESTTRAFPVQRLCILMAWQKDHEARNLEVIMGERRSLNRSRTSVVREFKEIMKDTRVRDWKNLAHFSNLRQSTRRVEWTCALRKESTCLPSIHIRSQEIASCSKLILPIVKCWTTGLTNAIMNAARKGAQRRSTIASRTRRCCWDGRGEDFEHHSGQRCRATRMGGSWCVRSTTSQRSTPSCSWKTCTESACHKLAKEVAKYEDKLGLTRAIMKSWSKKKKNSNLTPKLRVTCKSHKPAGEVSFRSVHASVGHPLAGLAQWVAQKLRTQTCATTWWRTPNSLSNPWKGWESVIVITGSISTSRFTTQAKTKTISSRMRWKHSRAMKRDC